MSHACKSWDLIVMGGLKQTSPTNVIFFFITEAKARWKTILTHYLKKMNVKRQGLMTSWSSIMEKASTLPYETIHITFKCAMHFHGHWDKVVPHMKPFILVYFSNGIKFHNYTYWSINETRNHYLPHWISKHHINNKDLVLSGHVKINL